MKSDEPSTSDYTGISTLVCTIAMCLFFVLFLWHHLHYSKLESQGVSVKGTVTNIEESRGRRSRIHRYPTVSFTTEDGKQMSVKTSQSGGFEVGQDVDVVYFPDSPEKAEIKGSETFSLFNFYSVATIILLIMTLYFGAKWLGTRKG